MTPPSATAAAAAPATRARPRRAPAKRRPPAAVRKRPSKTLRATADGRPQMTIYRSGSAIPELAGRAGVVGVAAAGRAGVAGAAAAGRVGVAVRELPDSGAVVRLTRGRLWIGVLGALLAGIVALNVISLGLTSGAGQTGVAIDQLQNDNSALRAEIAEKLSATRVQSAAPTLGLSVPPPVDITYITYNASDLGRAAKMLAGEATAAAAPWTPSVEPETTAPAADVTQPVPSTESATSSPSTPTTTSTPAPASSTSVPAAPSAPSASGGGSSGGVGTGL
jgi:hypothetical protein